MMMMMMVRNCGVGGEPCNGIASFSIALCDWKVG